MIVLTQFGERSAEDIRAVGPDVEAIDVPSEGDLPDGVTGDALVTLAWGSPNLAHILERGVTWVHTIGTGVDRFPLDLITDGVTLNAGLFNLTDKKYWQWGDVRGLTENSPSLDRYTQPGRYAAANLIWEI